MTSNHVPRLQDFVSLEASFLISFAIFFTQSTGKDMLKSHQRSKKGLQSNGAPLTSNVSYFHLFVNTTPPKNLQDRTSARRAGYLWAVV